MRVTADETICIGAGVCVVTAPDVFDQRDTDGVVVVTRAEPPAASLDAARNAAALCPAGAISVDDGARH